MTAIATVQRCASSGNAIVSTRSVSDERGRLRRRRHERRHRRRRALVDVGRPHVERRRRGLEAEPGDDHREPGRRAASRPQALRGDGVRDPAEAELARRAVDERRAEQEARRSRTRRRSGTSARPRASRRRRGRSRRGCRAQIENHSSPRNSVIRLFAATRNDHPAAGGREQRVVLGDVVVAPRSEYATPTARRPAPATTICASAASRSRMTASAIDARRPRWAVERAPRDEGARVADARRRWRRTAAGPSAGRGRRASSATPRRAEQRRARARARTSRRAAC